jgi:hypothetical protein
MPILPTDKLTATKNPTITQCPKKHPTHHQLKARSHLFLSLIQSFIFENERSLYNHAVKKLNQPHFKPFNCPNTARPDPNDHKDYKKRRPTADTHRHLTIHGSAKVCLSSSLLFCFVKGIFN